MSAACILCIVNRVIVQCYLRTDPIVYTYYTVGSCWFSQIKYICLPLKEAFKYHILLFFWKFDTLTPLVMLQNIGSRTFVTIICADPYPYRSTGPRSTYPLIGLPPPPPLHYVTLEWSLTLLFQGSLFISKH